MARQTVLFTALPAGVTDDGLLRLSVLVSPRLVVEARDEPVLRSFEDMRRWPEQDVRFMARIGDTPVRADPVGPELRPDLWEALFHDGTPVRSHTFDDFSGHHVVSPDVRSALEGLRSLYSSVARGDPTHFPRRDRVRAQLGRFPFLGEFLRTMPPPRTDVPLDLDFHQALAAMGDYPELLRLLGIVRDVVLHVEPSTDQVTTVQVHARWREATPTDPANNPITRCVVGPQTFRALTRGEMGDEDGVLAPEGLLPLGTDAWTVTDVDVDSAVLQLGDLLTTLDQLEHAATDDMPHETSLPALRSAGLALVHFERQLRIKRILERSHDLEARRAAGAKVLLVADDVTRGYAVDVFDAVPGVWRSLCQRRGDYHFLGTGERPVVPDDEGAVTLGAHAADASLHVHKVLTRWRGWSLVAPRPGRFIDEAEQPATGGSDPIHDFPLQVSFAPVDGSLPRLRFGRSYRLRARAVDLAGNTVPLEDAPDSDDLATPPITYGRYEPVPPPYVALGNERKEAESVEHVVLRSNFDAPPDDAEVPQRYLFPPKAAWLTVEEHGRFDAGGTLRIDAHARYAEREAGALAGEGVTDPVVGPRERVPYLADPLAAGVVLSGLPGHDQDAPLILPFSRILRWPDQPPLRLVLTEGTPDVHVTEEEGQFTVTVWLPKAEVLDVRSSSLLLEEDLDRMGLWHWLDHAARDQVRDVVLAGRHWMFTPSRSLVFVHAVRQPVRRPQLARMPEVLRRRGDTAARVKCRVRLHRAGTDRISILATWTEPVDAGPGTPLTTIAGRAIVGAVPVSGPVGKGIETVRVRHELGDTKHRRIQYRPIAASRFSEYFPDDPGADRSSGRTPFTRAGRSQLGHVYSSARPAAPDVCYAVPTFGWEVTASPDGTVVRARRGQGVRVFLRRPWFSSGADEMLGVVTWLADDELHPKTRSRVGPHLSQVGSDPLWRSADVPDPLRPAHFPSGYTVDVQLAELQSDWLALAVHDVHFDVERDLWFSDISLDVGPSYFPFVRLALVRYQPHSLRRVEVSPAVMAEFVQLAPDRTVTLVRTGGEDVEVTVRGPSYLESAAGAGPSTMSVSVEVRDDAVSDERIGWSPLDLGDGGRDGPAVQLDGEFVDGNVAQWTGRIRLAPVARRPRARIVFEEREHHVGSGRPDAPTSRVVYVDQIELSDG